MAFKEVQSLDAGTTIALGGINKKTGKANPKSVEGFYLGARTVESKMSRSGECSIHFFQTENGNIGVWGKTDLDRKLKNVVPGTMVRASFTGTQPVPGKQDMYKYRVEIDESNTIEVAGAELENYGDDEETDLDEEEGALDALSPAYPTQNAASSKASIPDAAQQARVKSLLNGKGRATV